MTVYIPVNRQYQIKEWLTKEPAAVTVAGAPFMCDMALQLIFLCLLKEYPLRVLHLILDYQMVNVNLKIVVSVPSIMIGSTQISNIPDCKQAGIF